MFFEKRDDQKEVPQDNFYLNYGLKPTAEKILNTKQKSKKNYKFKNLYL